MEDLKTEIIVLKKDVNSIASVSQKMESAIEKMSEVSNSIARMLAVHEEKLLRQEQFDVELANLVDKNQEESNKEIEEVYSRLYKQRREISEEIIAVQTNIIVQLREGIQDLKNHMNSTNQQSEKKVSELEKRLRELENWRWLVIGISIISSFFLREIITFFKQ